MAFLSQTTKDRNQNPEYISGHAVTSSVCNELYAVLDAFHTVFGNEKHRKNAISQDLCKAKKLNELLATAKESHGARWL